MRASWGYTMTGGALVQRRIGIHIGEQTYTATLHENAVADALWQALPIEVDFNTWGDEIYFDTGVVIEPESTQPVVDLGDIAYWPPGRAMCLFYGPTPASRGEEIRPAGPVTVIGRLDGDPRLLKGVHGNQVRVTPAQV